MLWAAFITIPGFLSAKPPTASADIFTRRAVAFARPSDELAESDLAGAALGRSWPRSDRLEDLHAQAMRFRPSRCYLRFFTFETERHLARHRE
jgi:hypothetical protein